MVIGANIGEPREKVVRFLKQMVRPMDISADVDLDRLPLKMEVPEEDLLGVTVEKSKTKKSKKSKKVKEERRKAKEEEKKKVEEEERKKVEEEEERKLSSLERIYFACIN